MTTLPVTKEKIAHYLRIHGYTEEQANSMREMLKQLPKRLQIVFEQYDRLYFVLYEMYIIVQDSAKKRTDDQLVFSIEELGKLFEYHMFFTDTYFVIQNRTTSSSVGEHSFPVSNSFYISRNYYKELIEDLTTGEAFLEKIIDFCWEDMCYEYERNCLSHPVGITQGFLFVSPCNLSYFVYKCRISQRQ